MPDSITQVPLTMDYKDMYKSLNSKQINLKDKKREEQNDLWKKKRYEIFCRKRTMVRLCKNSEDEISVEQIQSVSKKLKDKKENHVQHLKLLINGLSQGTDNIHAYLVCDHSLTTMVGFLLGSDAEMILLSAWCLTNLATGTEKQASVIIKHASPYLITLLSSFAPDIQDQCAWALGNLASHGDTHRRDLIKQGILAPLTYLLRSSSKNVIKSAAFAFSNMMKSELARRDPTSTLVFEEMSKILGNTKDDDEILCECLWTLSLLIPDLKFEHAKLDEVESFVSKLIKLLAYHTMASNLNVQILTPLIRIVGNLVCELPRIDFHKSIKNSEIFIALERLLSSNILHLQKETIWAVSNISGHCQLATAVVEHGIDERINMLLKSNSRFEDISEDSASMLENNQMDFESFKI